MTRDDLSTFTLGMIRIVMDSGQRISKHRGCFLERNAMFANVLPSLCRVPGELHMCSLRLKTKEFSARARCGEQRRRARCDSANPRYEAEACLTSTAGRLINRRKRLRSLIEKPPLGNPVCDV